MTRHYSWPAGHWNWPVTLTHQHGVRSGEFIFTGGQAALDAAGSVMFPDELESQVELVLGYVHAILEDLDSGYQDLVKLVCYFTGDERDQSRMLDLIDQTLGPSARPVVNIVNLPQLCYPGMRIELEGIAIDNASAIARFKRIDGLPKLHAGFSHVVRCGDYVATGDMSATNADGQLEFPNDLARQTLVMMQQLGVALASVHAGYQDVLKLNVFYKGDGTAENWEKPALTRASFFEEPGPAATGITVPGFAHAGLMTTIAVTAMSAPSGEGLPKDYAWPDGHWDWTTHLPYKHGNRCGRMIHLGGQVSLDADSRVLDPADMVAQTKRAMNYIEHVLAELGAKLDDVVKVTTFYRGEASADSLHENLLIRSGSYSKPGPATTGIPVPHLVYEKMDIEIEVTALIDN